MRNTCSSESGTRTGSLLDTCFGILKFRIQESEVIWTGSELANGVTSDIVMRIAGRTARKYSVLP